MKYLKKKEKKKNTGLIVLICVLCAAVVVAGVWFAVSHMGNSEEKSPDAVSAETTQAPETVIEPVADFNIETPYGTLVFSGEWGNNLAYNAVEGDPASVQFFAVVRGEEVPLFDILFGSMKGEQFGYLTDEAGSQVSVSVELYDITPAESWTENERYMVYGMQDELNDLIAQFNLAEKADNTTQDVAIETAYSVLYYPGTWSSYLRTEVKDGEGCVVSFYGNLEGKEEVHLFDIMIGSEGESLIGILTGEDGSTNEVYMTSYDFTPDDSWSDAEINLIYGMQEDANYIFTKWEQSGIFTF